MLGSETSQYQQEKKLNKMLLVSARKNSTGQTESAAEM